MQDRLTVRQVAERLGLSRQRVHQFIEQGRLHPTDTVNDGGRTLMFLFSEAEINRFIRAERPLAGSA